MNQNPQLIYMSVIGSYYQPPPPVLQPLGMPTYTGPSMEEIVAPVCLFQHNTRLGMAPGYMPALPNPCGNGTFGHNPQSLVNPVPVCEYQEPETSQRAVIRHSYDRHLHYYVNSASFNEDLKESSNNLSTYEKNGIDKDWYAEEWSEQTEKLFVEWAWKGNNLNKLIKILNNSEYRPDLQNDHLRREAESPTVYGIVLNDDKIPGGGWKYVKIGLTRVSTQRGTKNRMEVVQKNINNKYKEKTGKDANACILFLLPINDIDTTPQLDIEERIRKHFGMINLSKERAKETGLSNPTEWVVTLQKYIYYFKERYDFLHAARKRITTEIFKEEPRLRFNNYLQTVGMNDQTIQDILSSIEMIGNN